MGYCLVSCVFVLLLFLQAVSGVVCSELRDFRKLWSSKSAVSGAHMLRYLQGIYIFISSLFLLPHSHMMICFHLPTWRRMHLEVDRLMQNSLVIYRAVGVVAWVSFFLLALSLPSTLLSFPFTRCNYPSSFNNNEPTSSFIFLLLTSPKCIVCRWAYQLYRFSLFYAQAWIPQHLAFVICCSLVLCSSKSLGSDN